jgi:short-subunit dehydrogenase
MDWRDKVAIVTGASSGIGLAVARALVERGTRVALVARSRDKLEALAAELGPARAAAFPLDVTDRAGLAALPAAVVARLGRLDILVNNAGANHRGPVSARGTRELTEILETNLMAPVLLVHAALPHIGRGGAIVNIASLAGKIPVADEATYSASKSGLRAFTFALHDELAAAGVQACAVNPGPVDTAFFGDVAHVPDLVFSQPMSSAADVADAVVRAVESGVRELDVPPLSGKLATLGYLSPTLYARLRPLLERRGARNKRRYLARRG